MTTILFAFGLMLLVVAAMALGVVFGRQPIKGSCGGMSAVGIDAECEICGGNPARCDAPAVTAEQPDAAQRPLAYDACGQASEQGIGRSD